MRYLKQNTETIEIIGMFVNYLDGTTPETGVTLVGALVPYAIKSDGTESSLVAGGNVWNASANVDGHYYLTLKSTDTNVLGRLVISITTVEEALPVVQDFEVITESAWNALFGDSIDEIKTQTDSLDFINSDPSTGKGEIISTLSSTGLDDINIAEPTGRASNFREIVIQLWMRFFNKVDKTSNQIRVYDEGASGTVTTQSYDITNGVETVDEA